MSRDTLVGAVAESSTSLADFWDRTYVASDQRLDLARLGTIWEAIDAARLAGSAAARTIAVIDHGFRPDLIGVERLHPASVTPRRADTERHGTVVALLIKEVIPDATFLLLDTFDEGITLRDTTRALRLADGEADVVNISLQFPSDAPMRDRFDLAALAASTVESETLLAAIDRLGEQAEPYAERGCIEPCILCAALREVALDALIVVASGNLYESTCPACCDAALGIGFRGLQSWTVDGVSVEHSVDPETTGNRFTPEIRVAEPPGFTGTSFAAPLVAGLAMLCPEPLEFGDMARLSYPLDALRMFQFGLAFGGDLGADRPERLEAWRAGLAHFQRLVPEQHHHWKQPLPVEPCGVCAFVLRDLYDMSIVYGSLTGRFDVSIGMGRRATQLSPFASSSLANHGHACLSFAEHAKANGWNDQFDAAVAEAAAVLEVAVDRAPDRPEYQRMLSDARAWKRRRVDEGQT